MYVCKAKIRPDNTKIDSPNIKRHQSYKATLKLNKTKGIIEYSQSFKVKDLDKQTYIWIIE